MASAAVTDTHTYRISFWRIYFAAVVYAQVLFAPAMWGVFYLDAVRFSMPFPTAWNAVLYVVGSVLVNLLMAPAFWVYVRALPVRVSAEAFTCSNGFGKTVAVPWDSITGVKHLPLPGFPYLLVTTTRTKLKLWLPLLLRDLRGFTEKVEEHAGPDHPLFHALWPRVEQK
jgi:hypothetical protein